MPGVELWTSRSILLILDKETHVQSALEMGNNHKIEKSVEYICSTKSGGFTSFWRYHATKIITIAG